MTHAFGETLASLTVVCAGVLAGIVVSEHVIILPLVRAAAPGVGVAGLRFAGARAWRLAPACGVVAGVSATALLVVWPWHGVPAAAALTIAALAIFLLAV